MSYFSPPPATKRKGTSRSMDARQFRIQMNGLHPAAYGWALHCCKHNRAVADDVLQIVYLKILEGKARFDGRSAFKTWLFAVIRKTASEERRRKMIFLGRFRFLAEGEDPKLHESVETPIHESENRDMLVRAFARLSRRQQEVLHLVFYQDLTIEETSATLGISLGSVRTHYERGKKRLRKELECLEEFNENR